MTELEQRMFKLKVFILKGRNRTRVAELSGIHRHTVSYFLNDKHSITLKNVIAIDKAVTLIKSEKYHGDV